MGHLGCLKTNHPGNLVEKTFVCWECGGSEIWKILVFFSSSNLFLYIYILYSSGQKTEVSHPGFFDRGPRSLGSPKKTTEVPPVRCHVFFPSNGLRMESC